MSGQVRLTLADLADGGDVSTTITLRGKTVTVRDLSLHERNLLIAGHGEPAEDATAAEKKIHSRERLALTAAVALDYAPQMGVGLVPMTLAMAGKVGQQTTWAKNALGEIQERLSPDELTSVINALTGLSTAGQAGNSSGPAAPGTGTAGQ